MKYFGFLLLIFCITSCDYFEKKKVNAEDILDQELKTFNWNEVDEYPSFSTCDASDTKENRKRCFETTLSQHILTEIGTASIIVNEAIQDTVMMTFQISEEGILRISNIQSNAKINDQIPDLESILRESINGLPEIFPALKRGQQVKTEFKMPIVINTD